MVKLTKAIITISIIVSLLSVQILVYAESSYPGYVYDSWDKVVPSPNGYLPCDYITGKEIGIGDFKEPQDLYVDRHKNELYIADSGNNRIVVVNSDFKVINVFEKFILDDRELALNNPKGIFVTKEGNIYIADQGNGRVVVADKLGTVLKIIEKPESDIIPDGFVYSPEKVAVDSHGIIYVQAYGVYQGLISFNYDGKFLGYFGSNRVELSFSQIRDLFWRKFFSKKQKEAMLRYVPVEYSNVYIGEDNFKYVTVRHSPNSLNEIKKLNNLGINILRAGSNVSSNKYGNSINYGDGLGVWIGRNKVDTVFVDINVDSEGFISVLDATRGRVFQYDQESNLLFIFGGKGSQLGTFKSPVALETFNNEILVLDSEKANITRFSVTSFGEMVRDAIKLYNDGLYEQALGPWREVIKRNSNYELACTGIGKALYNKATKENYKEAMKYFRLANNKKGYSDAFRQYSIEVVRDKFGIFATGILVIWLIIILFKYRNKYFMLLKPLTGGHKNG